MTEGTKNFFKFRNISLWPTRQNTILPTEGTAEEQFQLIEASAHQQALDDIREDTQPTAPEQSHDISSSSSLCMVPKYRATVDYTLIGVEPHGPTRGVWPIAVVAMIANHMWKHSVFKIMHKHTQTLKCRTPA